MNVVDSISGKMAVILGAAFLALYFFGGQMFDPEGTARRSKLELAAREDTFRELCPDYFQWSFAQRLASDRGWCNDYRDRI